ncbi:MAG: efflux RND transporter periplasmic adaptor subunit [Kiritimatiellia bacterium]
MTKKRFYTIIKALAALAALLLIMLWASGALQSRMPGGRLALEKDVTLPPGGVLLTVAFEQIPDFVGLSGTVSSERHITLSARLPAFVEAVHVNAGDRVPEAHLLIELDQRELREEQAAAQAALHQAETAFRRSERLLETNATTPQAHEAAESNFLAAQAQAERVKVMISYTRIQAPITGVVADRFVEAGDLASMGQPLLSIYDPTHLRIEVPVPASLIHHFQVGTQLPVILDLETKPRNGIVTEIVSAFDPVTRTRRVKLRLADAGENILPGMYGEVIVPAGQTRTIMLPAHAIKRIGQLESVTILSRNGLERRLVRTGPHHNGMRSVVSGLNEGDQVWIPDNTAAETEGA